MRIKCIGCEALARLVYLNAATSPHIIDLEIHKLGLHVEPASLRDHLQARVDACEGQNYDAIVMAYGLCGKATNGLIARSIPLVIPRAHDCITLFLGSRATYKYQFENKSGTYWYALDYLQRNDSAGVTLSLGASDFGADLKETYQSYVEKYGQDNADYLMGIMGGWQKHYKRAAYIEMGVGDGSEVENKAKADAEQRGWTYERMQGDPTLIRRLLYGEWDDDFLVLKPGQQIKMTYDDCVIGAENAH